MVQRISSLFSRQSDKSGPSLERPDSGLRERDAKAFCDTYEGLNLGGFWSTDAEGGVTYLSQKMRDMLTPGQDWKGRKLSELLVAADDGDDTVRNLQFYLVRKTRFEKVAARSITGEEVNWWSISGEPQFDKASRFTGFRGHCADITGERQIAEEASQLAMHDPLTGLLNRRSMSKLLDRTLLASKHQSRKTLLCSPRLSASCILAKGMGVVRSWPERHQLPSRESAQLRRVAARKVRSAGRRRGGWWCC